MAESLAVVLAADAAVTESGASSAVDLGTRRSALALVARVTELEVGVRLALETSPTSTGPWRVAEEFNVPDVEEKAISVAGLQRYVRVAYDLTASATATFSCDGVAHTLYAGPVDITRFAVSEAAIAEVTPTQRADALIAASDVAEGYLSAAGYTLPLTAWGNDIRQRVAQLAAATIFRVRGYDPEGPDKAVFDAEAAALKWFEKLAAGTVQPSGVVDSSSDDDESSSNGSAAVYTTARRGW